MLRLQKYKHQPVSTHMLDKLDGQSKLQCKETAQVRDVCETSELELVPTSLPAKGLFRFDLKARVSCALSLGGATSEYLRSKSFKFRQVSSQIHVSPS